MWEANISQSTLYESSYINFHDLILSTHKLFAVKAQELIQRSRLKKSLSAKFGKPFYFVPSNMSTNQYYNINNCGSLHVYLFFESCWNAWRDFREIYCTASGLQSEKFLTKFGKYFHFEWNTKTCRNSFYTTEGIESLTLTT